MSTAPRARLNPASFRAGFRDLLALLAVARRPRGSGAALVALGLAASLTETAGLTLVLMFLYLVTGRVQEAVANGGVIGRLAGRLLSTPSNSFWLGGLLLALIFLRALLAMVYNRTSGRVAEEMSESVRDQMHAALLHTAYPNFARYEQSPLLEIIGKYTWHVSGIYLALTRLAINAMSILFFVVLLLAVSVPLVVVGSLGYLLAALVTRRASRRVAALGEALTEQYSALGEHMLTTVQAMRTIRAYGVEAAHQARFERTSTAAKAMQLELHRLNAALGPVTELANLLVLLAVAGVAWTSAVPFPVLVGAVAIIYRLQPHLHEVQGNFLTIAQTLPQLSRLREALALFRDQPQPDGTEPIATPGEIRFDDVTFAYRADGVPVLDRLSLRFPKGQRTALLGKSGAGKTTVIRLLLRLYEAQAGAITVDGRPIERLRRADWLGMVGVAGQDIELVEGTVAENIRLSNPAASAEQVRRAAELAGVTDFLDILPDGLDTWIGVMDVKLSGGQRQRINLARLILRDPQLIILDEAMSEVDIGLEQLIRRNVEREFAGRTIIIITHRLETATDVDHAIWLDGGRCVAQGAPAEVLALGRRISLGDAAA